MKRVAIYPAFVILLLTGCTTLELSQLVSSGQKKAAFVQLPTHSSRFWKQVMTYQKANKYKAKNGVTFCNIFFLDTLERFFGKALVKRIFPQGVKRPNEVYYLWRKNPNLVRLGPDRYSIEKIQQLAEEGTLIMMVYLNRSGPGHMAFVGTRSLRLFTIPSLSLFEGRTGSSLSDNLLPVMVQAGTYTGITTMVYATNGWIKANPHHFRSGIVMYYAVKNQGVKS